jgi:hypothetical protein
LLDVVNGFIQARELVVLRGNLCSVEHDALAVAGALQPELRIEMRLGHADDVVRGCALRGSIRRWNRTGCEQQGEDADRKRTHHLKRLRARSPTGGSP